MKTKMNRRQFIELSLAGGALYFAGSRLSVAAAADGGLVSPGCRTSKVKVARLYLGKRENPHWPKPNLDIDKEAAFYNEQFDKLKPELSDVDFVVDELVTGPQDVHKIGGRLKEVDGIVAVHFNMGVMPSLKEVLRCGKPTMLFAAPYSGHEWTEFGQLARTTKMDCILTSDYSQLAAAIRPFRAIHHAREARILNLTTHDFTGYAEQMKAKFGTTMQPVTLDKMLAVYNSVPEEDAVAEAERWIKNAVEVIEPPRQEIIKSCRLALAFEKLLSEENATVMTADCYGSMYEKLCKAHAFPCIGFTRLNDMGLGGICESDLRSAMTHIIMQGLSGRPGFISDPTVDQSGNSIILAHCLGSTRMDGPDKPAEKYKIRTIMERQEGAVTQVTMQTGRKATQAILIADNLMRYFTGEIIDAPTSIAADRGCRTKITVKVDGDAEKLWRQWGDGLHRVTVYGDIVKDLERFCKFTDIKILNEAAS